MGKQTFQIIHASHRNCARCETGTGPDIIISVMPARCLRFVKRRRLRERVSRLRNKNEEKKRDTNREKYVNLSGLRYVILITRIPAVTSSVPPVESPPPPSLSHTHTCITIFFIRYKSFGPFAPVRIPRNSNRNGQTRGEAKLQGRPAMRGRDWGKRTRPQEKEVQ